MKDITELCEKMEKCRRSSICQSNEIVCAKKYLNEYIKNDYNNLLKLKAQVKTHMDVENRMMNSANFAFTVITTIVTFFGIPLTVVGLAFDEQNVHNLFAPDLNMFLVFILITYVALVVIYIGLIIWRKETSNRRKWIRYVEVALQNIEEKAALFDLIKN